jgi:hypothetical protein
VLLPAGVPEVVQTIAGLAGGQLAIDSTAAYVAAVDAILRVPLDGSATSVVAAGLVSPGEILASADMLYTVVGTGSSFGVARVPIALAIDARAVYAVYCCQDALGGGQVVRIAL